MAKTKKTPVWVPKEVADAVDEFRRSYHVTLSRNQAAELLIRHALTAHGVPVKDPSQPSDQ